MSIKLKDTIYDLINNSNFAKQLNTARTLWGQSFDGTENISGNLSSIGIIQFSNAKSFNIRYNGFYPTSNSEDYWWGISRYDTNVAVSVSPVLGVFQTRYTTYLATSSGNVGIGTTAPNYKLDVNGSLNATTIYQNGSTLDSLLGTKLNTSSYTAADVLTKLKTVDGSGSGLDADTLDGYDSSLIMKYGGNWTSTTDTAGIFAFGFGGSAAGLANNYGAGIQLCNAQGLTAKPSLNNSNSNWYSQLLFGTDNRVYARFNTNGGGWSSQNKIAYITDNVASASKLATTRTISLTGSVTGSGSFDGSGNLSIATTTNHTHSYAATNHTHSNLIIQGNGTTLGTYTGGSAVTVNLTYSNVGAASSGHTHDYASSSHNHNGVYAVQCGSVSQSGRVGYSGFYETSGATSSAKNHPFSSGWMHFINCQHSNTSNNYALQIAASFYDNTNFKIRVTNGSDSTTWNTILHSGNWSSYCAAASHTHNYLSSLPSHTHNYAGSSSAGGDATMAIDSYALVTKETGTVANTWGNHGIRTFIGGWATTSAGFSTQYGTTLNIAGYSTWYYRLAFCTSGRIEYWRGINTTTLGRIGYLAYTSDIPTSLPANGGNADTTDSHHFSTVSSLPSSPNANTVYFIV